MGHSTFSSPNNDYIWETLRRPLDGSKHVNTVGFRHFQFGPSAAVSGLVGLVPDCHTGRRPEDHPPD